jgi:preprotein translocase subunit SecD
MDVLSTQPAIAVKMSRSSAQFAQFTLKNLDHKFDIRIDGKTVTSPVIRESIMQGRLQISRRLTMRQARDLADRIAAGKSKIEFDLTHE